MAHYPLFFGPVIIGALMAFSAAFYAVFLAQPLRPDTKADRMLSRERAITTERRPN
jgi:uncharacterized membrane protein YccC